MTKTNRWTRWMLIGLLAGVPLAAQDFEFYPNASYDPAVPTLQQVVGHSWETGMWWPLPKIPIFGHSVMD